MCVSQIEGLGSGVKWGGQSLHTVLFLHRSSHSTLFPAGREGWVPQVAPHPGKLLPIFKAHHGQAGMGFFRSPSESVHSETFLGLCKSDRLPFVAEQNCSRCAPASPSRDPAGAERGSLCLPALLLLIPSPRPAAGCWQPVCFGSVGRIGQSLPEQSAALGHTRWTWAPKRSCCADHKDHGWPTEMLPFACTRVRRELEAVCAGFDGRQVNWVLCKASKTQRVFLSVTGLLPWLLFLHPNKYFQIGYANDNLEAQSLQSWKFTSPFSVPRYKQIITLLIFGSATQKSNIRKFPNTKIIWNPLNY